MWAESTLASKYNFLIDIDSLHTENFRKKLEIKYQETLKTGNWESYNKFECNWILPYLRIFSYVSSFLKIVKMKAIILGLKILGSFKPKFSVIERVIIERWRRNKITLHNWINIKDAEIFDSHQKID